MKPCRYRSEGSDSRPYRMVPMCACGWSGDVEEGQDALHQLRSLQQWQRHVEKRVEALEEVQAAAYELYGASSLEEGDYLWTQEYEDARRSLKAALEGGKQDG